MQFGTRYVYICEGSPPHELIDPTASLQCESTLVPHPGAVPDPSLCTIILEDDPSMGMKEEDYDPIIMKTDVFIITYKCTDRVSFLKAAQIYNQICRLKGADVVKGIVLVATHADTVQAMKKVTYLEGATLAENWGVSFVEVNAVSGANIKLAFFEGVRSCPRPFSSEYRVRVFGVGKSTLSIRFDQPDRAYVNSYRPHDFLRSTKMYYISGLPTDPASSSSSSSSSSKAKGKGKEREKEKEQDKKGKDKEQDQKLRDDAMQRSQTTNMCMYPQATANIVYFSIVSLLLAEASKHDQEDDYNVCHGCGAMPSYLSSIIERESDTSNDNNENDNHDDDDDEDTCYDWKCEFCGTSNVIYSQLPWSDCMDFELPSDEDSPCDKSHVIITVILHPDLQFIQQDSPLRLSRIYKEVMRADDVHYFEFQVRPEAVANGRTITDHTKEVAASSPSPPSAPSSPSLSSLSLSSSSPSPVSPIEDMELPFQVQLRYLGPGGKARTCVRVCSGTCGATTSFQKSRLAANLNVVGTSTLNHVARLISIDHEPEEARLKLRAARTLMYEVAYTRDSTAELLRVLSNFRTRAHALDNFITQKVGQVQQPPVAGGAFRVEAASTPTLLRDYMALKPESMTFY
eukprot:TRINITY_DN4184_c0_g2_i2.p1 TRINITY_DN4184_c0_g2~~TRINITY_DN4184_c0_g2_i2.p1  ORF type:complete len:629 (+),score=126.72 TRINITY_DN4184_c0_g2_i2:94-1980(+)